MAKQSLSAKLRIGAALDRSVGVAFGGLKKGLQAVAKESRDVERRQREIGKTRDTLIKQGKAVDDLDREYADLGKTLVALQAKQRRLDRLDNSISGVGKSFQSLRSSAVRAGTGIAIGLTTAGGAAVSLVRSTADAGYEIDRLSTLSNASTDQFQRWAAASRAVGIEDEKLSDILKDVNDRVGDFVQTGGGPMADFFEKIAPKVGVTAEQFRNLSGPDALQLYVSSLQEAGVNQQDFTFYMEAMASDSTLLLPLLRDGGKELRRFGDAAAATGAIMDRDSIDASIRYRREIGQLGGVLMGVRNTMGGQLIPVFTEFAATANRWVQGNGPQIEATAVRIGDGLRTVVPVLWEMGRGFVRAAETGGRIASVAADALGGWQNLGAALGAVMAGPLIFRTLAFTASLGRLGFAFGAVVARGGAAVGLFTGVGRAAVVGGALMKRGLGMAALAIRGIGLAMAANPVGAAISVIALGATLIIANWDRLKPFFDRMWQGIKRGFAAGMEAISPVIGWFKQGAANLADGWELFEDRISALLERIGAAFERARDRIRAVVDYLKNAVSAVTDAGAAVGGSVRRGAGRVAESAGNAWSGVTGTVGGWWRGEQPQARAVGGAFSRGPLRVGERGEELIYSSSDGYVAHNRALRGLEGRAGRVRDLARSASQSLARSRPAPVSQAASFNVTINQAPGQDAASVVREIRRQLASAGRASLFDGVQA